VRIASTAIRRVTGLTWAPSPPPCAGWWREKWPVRRPRRRQHDVRLRVERSDRTRAIDLLGLDLPAQGRRPGSRQPGRNTGDGRRALEDPAPRPDARIRISASTKAGRSER
jgi:hypothetical protein